MVRKRIGKVFSPKIVAALLAAVISVSNVQSVNAVVKDNADSTSTEGSASEDEMLDGETAWVNGKQITGNIGTLNPDGSDISDGKSGENGVPSSGFNYEISSVGKDGQTIMIPKHMYTGKDDGKTFNIYIPSIKDLIAGSDPTDVYMQEKTVKVSEEDLVIEPDADFVGMTKLTIDPEDQLKKENIRDGVKIFGVTGNIKDLTGGDVQSTKTTADEKAANGFDYTVSSIGADGQTITIPKAKYSGDDDFKIYIKSILDMSANPDPTNPVVVPLQDRTLSTSDIYADVTRPTVATKTDDNFVGLSSVTIPSLKDLTPGTATAGQILSGEKAWVNGTKITGTMANNGALNKTGLVADGTYTIPAGYTTGGIVKAKDLASQTQATAVAGDILSGKTAWVNGAKFTGSMTNQGAVSQSLNAGGEYTIPAGYHNGQGKITANSLASQTQATAGAGDILSGKTAWVNGSLITGTATKESHTEMSRSFTQADMATADITLEGGKGITIPANQYLSSSLTINALNSSSGGGSGTFEIAETGKFTAKWDYYSNVSSPWKKSVDVTVDKDYSQLICVGSNTASDGAWAPGVHFTYKDQDLGTKSACIQNVKSGDVITIWHSQNRDLTRTDVTFTTTYTLVGGY